MGCCLAVFLALAWDALSGNSETQRVADELARVAYSAKGGLLACLVKPGMTPEQVRQILGSDFEVSDNCKCWDYSSGVTVTFSHRSIIGEPGVKVVCVRWLGPWLAREAEEDLRQIRYEWERIWHVEGPAKP
jgi:hypothetical protein